MIRYKTFEQKDLDGVTLDDNPDNRLSGFLGSISGMELVGRDNISLLDDDTLLAVGGVATLWRGVGEVWLKLTPEGRKHIKAIYETSRALIDTLFDEGYHRLQATILVEYEAAHRFIQRMGFVSEGIMTDYGPNKEHFVRYVRFGG